MATIRSLVLRPARAAGLIGVTLAISVPEGRLSPRPSAISGVTACSLAPSHGRWTMEPPLLAEATTTFTMFAGIGFAIPANMVKVVVASAKSGGSIVKRPWLGARLQAVTPEIAEGLGLKRPSGALVATVTPMSPAARAGLKTSDLIVAIDAQPVEDANAFDYRFATKAIGGSARLG